jgi:hypothetical protein
VDVKPALESFSERPLNSAVRRHTTLMRTLLIVPIILLLPACATTTVSEQAGGHGVVLMDGSPVAAAQISIVDAGGTQSGTTGPDGRFLITGISRKRLTFLMANPAYHEVKIRVKKFGVQTTERSIRKSIFGSADIDFGTIEVSR